MSAVARPTSPRCWQPILARPLEDEWPYLWIDATYVKARGGGRIVSTATIIAVGVNTDGRREVLGVATGPSEAETFRKGFLRSLADRGLRGVKLVITSPVRKCGQGSNASHVKYAGMRKSYSKFRAASNRLSAAQA